MSKTRANNRGGYRVLQMSGALYKSFILSESETKAPPKQPQQLGRIQVPNEVIVEMRRLHEVERLTVKQVQDRYPEYSTNYVKNVLQYIVRAKLFPPKE